VDAEEGNRPGDDTVQGIGVNGKPVPDAFGFVLGSAGLPTRAPDPSYRTLSRFQLQGKDLFTAGANNSDKPT